VVEVLKRRGRNPLGDKRSKKKCDNGKWGRQNGHGGEGLVVNLEKKKVHRKKLRGGKVRKEN